MSINEFNRRIRVKKYISGQDDSGGNVKSLTDYFDVWAKMENLNGNSRILDNLQITYTKAFKITTRYEASRPIIASDEIFYDGLTYTLVQTPTQIEEGRKSFNVMIAYTTGTESNTGDVITAPVEDVSGSLTLTAGQDLSSWRIVYIDNGTAYYYDPANTAMTNYAIGITKTAALQNHLIEVQTEGIFEATGLGLTPDKRYYAGASGQMVTVITGLTVLQQIGNSLSSDKLDINFDSPIITI